MEKDKKKKKNKFIILILILLILLMGFGYSALTSILNLEGFVNMGVSKWDVHFTNVKVKDGSVTASIPANVDYLGDVVNFGVNLDIPGDYYEFNVDVINDGTITAKIDNVPNVVGISNEQDVYINCSVTYSDGTIIKKNDTLKPDEKKTITVRVEFDKDVSEENLPFTAQTLNLSFPLNYVQG